MSTLENSQHSTPEAETTFGRVLVGIDGSPESLEAARQAALLEEPGGTLELLAAWNLTPPIVTPGLAPPVYETDEASAREDAERALHIAKTQLPSADALIVRGFAAHALIDEIGRARSTVVAVGSHGRGRATGIIVGSTATSLVHNAPCSVLVTRWRRAWVLTMLLVGISLTLNLWLYWTGQHLYLRMAIDVVLAMYLNQGAVREVLRWQAIELERGIVVQRQTERSLMPDAAADLALLRAFEPIVRYNRGELFYPTAVEGYLAECDLLVGTSEDDARVLLPQGEVTAAALARHTPPPGESLYLRLVQKPLGGVELARWRLRPDRVALQRAWPAGARRAVRPAHRCRLHGVTAAARLGPWRHGGCGPDQVRGVRAPPTRATSTTDAWSASTAGSACTTSSSTS